MAMVNVERVADALNLTPRRVQQLVKEGLPREKRGEYDPIKCMLWYIRYLQAQLSGFSPNVDLGGGEIDDERKERLRLLRADRELRELELARERGEFITLVDVEKLMNDLVVTTKAHILGVPNRVAPQLVGEDRVVIEAKLERALKVFGHGQTARRRNSCCSSQRSDCQCQRHIDLALLDLKCWNPELHRRLTGMENGPVLDFARRLAARKTPIWLRYVLVPGLTDNAEDIAQLAEFSAGLGNVQRVDVLPFHQMGRFKWKELKLNYTLGDVQPPVPKRWNKPARSSAPLGLRQIEREPRTCGAHTVF